uniref:Chemokine interleukin-8-like domain-containing protein n=1 Tax=Denticeps clupeoides TaxID=299321 RepID=A0AAY3ZVR3_9TELE
FLIFNTLTRSLVINAGYGNEYYVRNILGGKTGLSCCTTVSNAEISDPIISFSYQKDNGFECVNSVIITTERGPFCINPRSRWLLHKIREFLIPQAVKKHCISPNNAFSCVQ